MSEQIHQLITDRMIAALEHGTVPWHKPWRAAAGQPRSMTTGAPYRGASVFLLALTGAEHGYASPWWGTYRQITGLGGQVRKGEKSTLVVFWKPVHITGRDPETGEPATRQLPVLRYYRIFNAGQADRLPDRFHPQPGQDITIAEPQAVLDRYLARGPVLRHVAGDRADYHPATDVIRLPLRSQFRSPEQYYATAFHETGHSTGHPTRLNRPGIASFDHFGTDRYAREELAAQMTSSILCAQTGIDTPELSGNSASYIAGWLTALNNDNRLVITAAAQAQRACDLITQAQREPVSEHDPRREVVPAGDEAVPAAAATAALAGRQEAGPLIRMPQARAGDVPSYRTRPVTQESQHLAAPAVPAAGLTREAAPSGRHGGASRIPPEPDAGPSATRRERPAANISEWQAEAG